MMGFLSPALLLVGLSVAVPLVLHLFHRQQGQRVIFPALRYLRRAEKENARRIKLRQILLLALRVAALALLALAAARPFFRQGGGGHEPTAAVIILDNSLSSGLVLGDHRILDELKDRALQTLARAGADDRFWLIRAAEPWVPAVPGSAGDIAARVRETEVAANAADLGAALTRARALLAAGAEGRAREIHLLGDLQASGLAAVPEGGADAPPVVAWAPKMELPANAAVAAVEVGGGLAPRAGERSLLTAAIGGRQTGDTVPVRLAVDGRISAAAVAPTGTAAVLPFPDRAPGLVTGWVELDPDALRGDDRRYFALHVQPPPATALAVPTPFVDEALGVLADAGRIRRADVASAEVVVAPGGVGIDAARGGRTTVVLAPASRLELAAANRRLAAAGIPWRYAAPAGTGDARLAVEEENDELVRALRDARIREAYRLERQGPVDSDSVLLRLGDGAPWVVRGRLPGGGQYLLVGSPLSAEASTLPTSPAMVPLLDRLIGAWSAREADRARVVPGQVIALPDEATTIERPDGGRDTVAAGSRYRVPAAPGIYRILAGERMIDALAVNPPASESDLTRLEGRRLKAALPGWDLTLAEDAGDWGREVFRRRLGQEVWRPLLLLVLAALLIEGLVAASGRTAAAPRVASATPGAENLEPRTS